MNWWDDTPLDRIRGWYLRLAAAVTVAAVGMALIYPGPAAVVIVCASPFLLTVVACAGTGHRSGWLGRHVGYGLAVLMYGFMLAAVVNGVHGA